MSEVVSIEDTWKYMVELAKVAEKNHYSTPEDFAVMWADKVLTSLRSNYQDSCSEVSKERDELRELVLSVGRYHRDEGPFLGECEKRCVEYYKRSVASE